MRQTAPAARLLTHLRWMIGLRLVAISSLVLPYLLIQLSTELDTSAFDFLYLFAALTYGASLLYILAMKLGLTPLVQAKLQFVGDLVLVTCLVYYFGSASAFSILYVVVIMAAASLVGSRAALRASLAAWTLYAAVSIGSFEGWLPPSDGVGTEALTLTVLIYKLAVHFFGFCGVAILTSKLTAGVSQLESELEEKREDLADLRIRHQDILHSVTSGLLTTDLEGRITTINRAGEEILGRTLSELEDRPIKETELFTFEEWQRCTDNPEGAQRDEITLEGGDETRFIGFSITLLTSAGGKPSGWVLVFQELTEWRLLEEQVRLQDRMAAVGELAAGIAHELGNPLAAISGSVQMLSKSVDGDSPRRQLLDIMLKESQRLDRTIKGFLQFARPKERSIVEFDVCELLAENVELLRNSKEVFESHTLQLDTTPDSTFITADPDQISQLFWNLARNALRAMPQGGTLTVTGELAEDDYHLRFRDTGRGMSVEERRKIFHPFHTGFSGGTGIGMSIVYRIVEEHGGDLEVESQPQRGTTIDVRLPARLDRPVPMRAEA